VNLNNTDVEEIYLKLKLGLGLYRNDTNYYLDKFINIENKKNLFSILLFIIYSCMIILIFYLVMKKNREPVIYLSNIVFCTVPLLIIACGLISIYFFIYSDFCVSIHSAIYNDNFPIYNKGIGKMVSCFDKVIF